MVSIFKVGGFAMTENDLRKQPTVEDTNVYMYLLRFKGNLYVADCVEVTKDTAYFQVDAALIRKGLFPRSRVGLHQMDEMGIELVPVFHAPVEEQ
jgi:hypothetical protein